MRLHVLEPTGFTSFYKEKLSTYDLSLRFLRDDGVWSKPIRVSNVRWKDLENVEIDSAEIPFNAYVTKVQLLGPPKPRPDDVFFEVAPGARVPLFEMDFHQFFSRDSRLTLNVNITLPVWT